MMDMNETTLNTLNIEIKIIVITQKIVIGERSRLKEGNECVLHTLPLIYFAPYYALF